MPKRRAVVVESDSEDRAEGSSQGSKRARTEEDSGYDTPGPIQEVTRGRRRARRDDDEEGPEDEEENIEQTTPDEDEEKRFEDENEEAIRAKVLNKSKSQGGIAEMGIIEKLEMHQFMCHKYLTFTFGPQINFIIGHNGSGKSAVLSALTIALGGKATTTGRGNGLKSFIKEGQSASEVTVTIKNQGEEAYKPEEYGSSIVITRKFTKDGGSSYKICSKSGKTISTSRTELSAICDHMNIQVDNPMNILTQDSARQFLSASAPADKYKFFLRGTQLSQLSEEYSTCLENITQMQKVLVHKSEAIPDLVQALNEASARYEEADKARQQRHKADELKKELAWAYVVEKENEMRSQMETCEKQKRRLPKLEEEIAKAERSIQDASDKVTKFEEEIHALGTIEHLQAQRQEIKDQLKAGSQEIATVKADERALNESVQSVRSAIEEFERRIEEETQKQQENTQGKRDETNRKLEEAVTELRTVEKEIDDVKTRLPERETELQRVQNDGRAADLERQEIRRQIEALTRQISNCDEQERNELLPYGQNVEACLADITRARWHGSKPVGPFGMFVKVKDPQWAVILRHQLGGLMTSFAVTDGRDRPQLAQILKRHGNNAGIVIAERDLFDYSSGEPPAEYITVLRALEISDEFVLRILINQSHIESTMLAPTRLQGDQMLSRLGRGGLAWTNDMYRVKRYPEGGGSSEVLNSLRHDDKRNMLFREDGVGSRKIELQGQLQEAESAHQAINARVEQHQKRFTELKREIAKLQNSLRASQRKQLEWRQRRDALQEEINEDTPVAVQAFYDEIDSLKKQKASHIQQFTEITVRLEALNDAQRPLMAHSEELKQQIDSHNENLQEIRTRIEHQVGIRLQAQKHKEHWTSKLAAEQRKVDGEQEKLDQLEEEYKVWTAKAEEFCEKYPDPRSPNVVKRDLDGITNALKEREKRHGASVEEMAKELHKRKTVLEDTKKELKSMMALNKALKNSIRIRLKKWHEFRRHIALRCKIYFSYHLSIRGYYGKVLFDHVQGTLQLKVQTDDQQSTQTKEKDPRSLSGGEKSFSTICLLLSLWESIGCPIRCLDEFDVFMDAVNRRVSMKMMIDTANASDRKQYILITPQDMTNVQIGPTVRVHRMSDPERGQGVLALQ
ncbi:P-loop containing nucleoside triphosphate hydrolase protein [Cristinia sonorae]|uniref:P-loop containing nucleoside triphosphate hydrolase protein n=1 Tax=Cristinia sonorae TaxID=1940300 RepID=A0A8K0XJP3_9AGAR|nr:P-loop containing nucleoside triphosphate hydrolase protein [Cristinia sonorae]